MNNNTVQTIKDQLMAQGLRIRGLRFVAMDEATLKVSRGSIGAMVQYNAGSDLYDITSYEEFEIDPVIAGVQAENLLSVVSRAVGR